MARGETMGEILVDPCWMHPPSARRRRSVRESSLGHGRSSSSSCKSKLYKGRSTVRGHYTHVTCVCFLALFSIVVSTCRYSLRVSMIQPTTRVGGIVGGDDDDAAAVHTWSSTSRVRRISVPKSLNPTCKLEPHDAAKRLVSVQASSRAARSFGQRQATATRSAHHCSSLSPLPDGNLQTVGVFLRS